MPPGGGGLVGRRSRIAVLSAVRSMNWRRVMVMAREDDQKPANRANDGNRRTGATHENVANEEPHW